MTKYHSARYGPFKAGGYRFKDAGDKQGGVWTEAEKQAEAARVREQEQQAQQRQEEQDNG
jgi:hypothetical protein